VEVKRGVIFLVKLFLILTVGWFIYAFIRFAQELILGLKKIPEVTAEVEPDKNSISSGPQPVNLVKDSLNSVINND